MTDELRCGGDRCEAGDAPDRGSGAAPAPARRDLLLGVLAAGAMLAGPARADEEEKPGADERPQKGDLLVYAEGDQVGQIINPDDLPKGGPQVMAWPMDPQHEGRARRVALE